MPATRLAWLLSVIRNAGFSRQQGGDGDGTAVAKFSHPCGIWCLAILHANGVQAHQPRAAALGKPSRNPNPPCKGGGSPRDLRPCRAQEPSKAGFPRVLPWAAMLRAFSAGSIDSRRAARMSKPQGINPADRRSVTRFLPWRSRARTGHATEKPPTLLERIGDLLLIASGLRAGLARACSAPGPAPGRPVLHLAAPGARVRSAVR